MIGQWKRAETMTFYARIKQIYSFIGEKNTFAEQNESTNKKTA